jgi:hypothetical protein
MLPQSLPLLALAPKYKTQKILEILSLNPHDRTTSRLTAVMEKNPDVYLTQIFNNDPFFNMLTPDLRPAQEKLFNETTLVFRNKLLPEDLKTISSLMEDSLPFGRNFLEFLAAPLLGGKNVRLSGGPRPRIRPGGWSVEIENLMIDRGYILYLTELAEYLKGDFNFDPFR